MLDALARALQLDTRRQAAPRATQAFAETTNGGFGSLSLQSSRNAVRPDYRAARLKHTARRNGQEFIAATSRDRVPRPTISGKLVKKRV